MRGNPDRRQLVTVLGASAVASVTGCLDSRNSEPAEGSNDTVPPRTTNGASASTEEVDESGPVEKVEFAAPPDESPFKHTLGFLAQPTEERPAQLRVSVTNVGDGDHTIQTNNWGLPFPARAGKAIDGDEKLVLSTDGDAEYRDDCWRDYPKTSPRIDTKTLSPDETVSATYALVNGMETAACWPSGKYRFSQRYEVDPEGDGTEYDWWFVVSV